MFIFELACFLARSADQAASEGSVVCGSPYSTTSVVIVGTKNLICKGRSRPEPVHPGQPDPQAGGIAAWSQGRRARPRGRPRNARNGQARRSAKEPLVARAAAPGQLPTGFHRLASDVWRGRIRRGFT